MVTGPQTARVVRINVHRNLYLKIPGRPITLHADCETGQPYYACIKRSAVTVTFKFGPDLTNALRSELTTYAH